MPSDKGWRGGKGNSVLGVLQSLKYRWAALKHCDKLPQLSKGTELSGTVLGLALPEKALESVFAGIQVISEGTDSLAYRAAFLEGSYMELIWTTRKTTTEKQNGLQIPRNCL